MTDTADSLKHAAAGADALKRAAAQEAVNLVRDGMVVGLGSGSTAELFAALLGERVRQGGLTLTGVPTSIRVGELSTQQGLTVVPLEEVDHIDLTVDGADEIQTGTLGLVKGRGGALLREKLVAASSERLCIIADDSKLVTHLGEKFAIPVAVVPFGWRQTADRIRKLGGEPTLRPSGKPGTTSSGVEPLLSDDGLFVLDCAFGPIADPAALAASLKGTLGVVEHGLFLGMANRAIVAGAGGITVLEPGQRASA
jgi:ribose 5-phosphate isomerase A